MYIRGADVSLAGGSLCIVLVSFSFELCTRHGSPSALQFAFCKCAAVLKPLLSASCILHIRLERKQVERPRLEMKKIKEQAEAEH